jgi:hypothetical protein
VKVTIKSGGVKRTIDGPFGLCASLDDLRMIVRCIQHAIGPEDERPRMAYGWVDIVELPAQGLPNTQTLNWSDQA